MKTIGFSHPVASPLWRSPAQALGPWLQRLKDALGAEADGSPAPQEASRPIDARPAFFPAFTPGTAASNDAVFGALPHAPGRPGQPAKATSLPRPQGALRVVREADAALQTDCAGRMVMSGSIADICAELDRMAQRAARAGE
ncbi:MAG: hypothetical protein ABIQ90_07215 [Polaromonas sp.]